MTEKRPFPSQEPLQLARHAEFARRLARGLVRDESLADDLVQETWVAVLRHPPREAGSLRGYLATSLRRMAGRLARSESRRQSHEEASARPEAMPSSAELAAAMEQHQRVVRAVLELPETTKSAILLRFFEGLPPREIARRDGVPVETVRTRLKRGLALLREKLDEREGGREAWAGVLLPLAGSSSVAVATSGAAATATGALLMTKFQVGMAVFLAAVCALLWKASQIDFIELEGEPATVAVDNSLAASERPVDSAVGRESATRSERTLAGSESTSAAVPAAHPRSIEGTIVVVDAQGEEHPLENGTFVHKDPNTKGELVVEVKRGAFAFPWLEVNELSIDRVELDGRPAYLDDARIAPIEGEPLRLRASWPRPSFLRVVDAVTGADLDDVTVLRGVMRPRDAVHPSRWAEEYVYVSEAASPIELRSTNEEEGWWVHSPGYSWGWVRFGHREGGEREVALEPGMADLEIVLEDFDPELNLWVHVFPAGWERSYGGLVGMRHPASDRLSLRGLPAGEVQVRAELGIWHNGPRELDREELELLPGIQNQVTLRLEENVQLPPAVPLAGRIVLPAAHPDLELSFSLRPTPGAPLRNGDIHYAGSLELGRIANQSRVRTFDAGNVTPGDYLFVSSQLQFWTPFEVGDRGARDVLIELPELGEVRARVHDESSGELLAVDKLTLSGKSPDLPSWTLASVEADPETKEYVFLAPVGRISVGARWNEFASLSKRIEVVPGTQELELLARRLPGAWIRLMDGDTQVPMEWGWSIDVTPTEGKAEARMSRVERGRAWITAEKPGTYVVELGEIPGFRPLGAQTLEVVTGDPNELVIELERR